MRQKMLWLAGALVIALAAVMIIAWLLGQANVKGVPGGSAADKAPVDPQKLMIPRWFLASIQSESGTLQVPEQTASLQFKPGGRAGGIGGCNTFSTSYEAGRDGRMSFGPVLSTEMACDKGMDIEKVFYDALPKVGTFQIEGGRLVLASMDGKTRLEFIRPPK